MLTMISARPSVKSTRNVCPALGGKLSPKSRSWTRLKPKSKPTAKQITPLAAVDTYRAAYAAERALVARNDHTDAELDEAVDRTCAAERALLDIVLGAAPDLDPEADRSVLIGDFIVVCPGGNWEDHREGRKLMVFPAVSVPND